MVDVLWTFIGFLIGLVTAGFAVEFGLRKLLSPPEHSKLTRVWSLSELPAPLVATSGVRDVAVPPKARVVTADRHAGPRDGVELRTHAGVQANFAVDATAARALLFLGDIRPGALALWTVDERLIERLRAEFHRLWSHSTDYVERVALGDVPQKADLTIQTEGVVQDVLPFRGQYLLRLSDRGETVGVLVEKELPVSGRRVSVTGVVRSSSSGYPLIEAVEVKAAA